MTSDEADDCYSSVIIAGNDSSLGWSEIIGRYNTLGTMVDIELRK